MGHGAPYYIWFDPLLYCYFTCKISKEARVAKVLKKKTEEVRKEGATRGVTRRCLWSPNTHCGEQKLSPTLKKSPAKTLCTRTMESREDLNTIFPFLPLILRSSSLFWPPKALAVLKALSNGPDYSGVDSGAIFFDAIIDLRDCIFLSGERLAPSAHRGYVIFFDQVRISWLFSLGFFNF